MPVTDWLARQFLLRHPELLGQFDFDNGTLHITISNPDKTRILAKYRVPPERFSELIQHLTQEFLK